jgi:peptide/nickel transport system substrate-binding protein
MRAAARSPRAVRAAVLGLVLSLLSASPSAAQTPKAGGWLNARLREDLPQGFAIHETSTISTLWPAMPCFNNLVLFDPLVSTHSADHLVGELAERWSWQDNYRNLVFFLRAGVRWHDGAPFSARDVKFTFDMLRETRDAPARLRINPRRDWYANVESVDVVDPHTVVFKLRRPQPSLLLMLASGFTPIYAAHVPPAAYRTGCVGTGPYKLKEWRRGEFVEYVKNPAYFVGGRPYLDGLRYPIIPDRSLGTAALQVGRVDVSFPGDTTKPMVERLKGGAPQLVVTPVGTAVVDHLFVNTQKPPFDNLKVRQSISRAIDRRGVIETVYGGGAILGASMAPKPYGVWSLLDKDLHALQAPGPAVEAKRQARTLLAQAGFTDASPLRVKLLTRGLPAFADLAAFIVSELRAVGVAVDLAQIESAQWEPLKSRGDFSVGVDRTGIEPDDPDTNFYENYGCASVRNYAKYCDDALAKLIDQQSQELDRAKRLALVQEIQRRLEAAAVRPVLVWRLDYFAQWPHVKNLVPHHSLYSWGRMQDVWLTK